jgi:hypothetical protein
MPGIMDLLEWLNRRVAPRITALGIAPRSLTLEVQGGNLSAFRFRPSGWEESDISCLWPENGVGKNVRAANGKAFLFYGRRIPILLKEAPVESTRKHEPTDSKRR